MHLVHLTIAPDAIVSSLLDWTDSEEYVSGNTREKRLAELWDHYRCFCEEAHIGDRASSKLFSVATTITWLNWLRWSFPKKTFCNRCSLYVVLVVKCCERLCFDSCKGCRHATWSLHWFCFFPTSLCGVLVFGSALPPPASHTTYTHTQLTLTQLVHTQLTHTQLVHTKLTYTQLTHTQLVHTKLTYTQLTHTQLTHTQLTHTQLVHTQLAHTQLVHTQLTHTQLTHTQLTHTQLTCFLYIYMYITKDDVF